MDIKTDLRSALASASTRAHDHLLLRGGRIARLGKQVVSYAPMAGIIAVAMGVGADLPGNQSFSVVGAAQAQSICDPSITDACLVNQEGSFNFGNDGEPPLSQIIVETSNSQFTFSDGPYPESFGRPRNDIDVGFRRQQTSAISLLFDQTYKSNDTALYIENVSDVNVIFDTLNYNVRSGQRFSSDFGYQDIILQANTQGATVDGSFASFGSPLLAQPVILSGSVTFTANSYVAYENFESFLETAGSKLRVENRGILESYNGVSAFGYYDQDIIRSVWAPQFYTGSASDPDWNSGAVPKLEGGEYALINSGRIRSESDSAFSCYNISCSLENSGIIYVDEKLSTLQDNPDFDITAIQWFAPIIRNDDRPLFSIGNSGLIRGGDGAIAVYTERGRNPNNFSMGTIALFDLPLTGNLTSRVVISNSQSGVIVAPDPLGTTLDDKRDGVIYTDIGGSVINSGTIGELQGEFTLTSGDITIGRSTTRSAIVNNSFRVRLPNLLTPFPVGEDLIFGSLLLSVTNTATGKILSQEGYGIYSNDFAFVKNDGLIQSASNDAAAILVERNLNFTTNPFLNNNPGRGDLQLQNTGEILGNAVGVAADRYLTVGSFVDQAYFVLPERDLNPPSILQNNGEVSPDLDLFIRADDTQDGSLSGFIGARSSGADSSSIALVARDTYIRSDFNAAIEATVDAGVEDGNPSSSAYASGLELGDFIIGREFSADVNVRTLGTGEASAYGVQAGNIYIGTDFSGLVKVESGGDNGFSDAYGVTAGFIRVGGDFSGDVDVTSGNSDSYGVLIDGGLFSIGGDFSGSISANARSGINAREVIALRIGRDFSSPEGDFFIGSGIFNGQISATSIDGARRVFGIQADGALRSNLDNNLVRLSGSITAEVVGSLEAERIETVTAAQFVGDLNLEVMDGGFIRAAAPSEALNASAYALSVLDASNVSLSIKQGGAISALPSVSDYAPAVYVELRDSDPSVGASIIIDNAGVLSGAFTLDLYITDANSLGVLNSVSVANSGSILADDNEAAGVDSASDAIGIFGGLFDGTSWSENPTRVSLTNSGTISAAYDAIYLGTRLGGSGSDALISNLAGGVIRGDSDLDDQGRAITDSADFGVDGFGFDSATTVLNAGSIVGGVSLGGGSDRFELIDGGTLEGSLLLGSGLDVFAVRAGPDVSGAGFVMPGSGGELDLGAMGIERVEKLGAGSYELGASDGSGLLVNALDVLEGRLVLSALTRVSEQASADAAVELGDANGRVLVGDIGDGALPASGLALEVGAGLDAQAIVLGFDAALDVVAGVGASVVRLVDGSGAAAGAGVILGGAGGQVVSATSVLAEDGVSIVHEARIANAIALGADNDRVVSNFGVFEGAIDLGDGDDVFEVFLRPDVASTPPASIVDLFGGQFTTVDGGAGDDALLLSLREGSATLNFNPLLIPDASTRLTSIERLWKGGRGELVFNFESGQAQGVGVVIEGPAAVTSQQVASGYLVTETVASGAARLSVREAGGLVVNGGDFILAGNATLDVAAGSTVEASRLVGTLASDSLLATSQAQTVLTAGTIIGDIDLGDGDDLLVLRASGNIEGISQAGAGADRAEIDAGLGGRTVSDGQFAGFTDLRLNPTTEGVGRFVVTAAQDMEQQATLDAGTGPGTSLTLDRGELNLRDAGSSVRAASVALVADTRLSGNGTIFADTATLAGVIAPGNSVGQLNIVGDLVLADTSVLDFELGAADVVGGPLNDLVSVTGDLVLDGRLTVAQSAGGNFTTGVYRLISYGGVLTDNDLTVLGPLPNGLSGLIQTGVLQQVNLVVTSNIAVDVGYWDGVNITPGNIAGGRGGSGIWDLVTTNWTTEPGDANGPWDGGVAVFGGQTGVVSVEDGLSFEGLQFVSDGYLLEAGAGGSLDLGTGAFVHVDTGLDAIITAPIIGSGGLIKQGEGRLILDGTNSYQGGTVLSAGTLSVGSDAALSSGSLALADGTTLQAFADSVTLSNSVSLDGVIPPAVTIDSQAFTFTLNGVIDGGGSVAKAGSGTLVLNGANSYTGGTTLASGTIRTGDNLSLGTSALTTSSDTMLQNGAAGVTLANTIAMNGSLNVDVNGVAYALSGTISGTGPLTVIDSTGGGVGSLTLSGVNSYSGGTIINGTAVQVDQDSNLGNTAGGITLEGGTLRTTASFASARTVVLGSGGGSVDVATGTMLTSSGVVSGSSLNKVGAGTLALLGANTHTGGTTLNAGRIIVDDNASLGTGTLSMADDTTLAAGADQLAIANLITTAGVATVDTGSNLFALSGSIAGAGGITKQGTGLLTLSGTSSYSGATIVASGTLNVSGSLVSSTTINSGATLVGTGTVGAIDANSGALVSPGAPGTNDIATLTATGSAALAGTYNVDIVPSGNDLISAGGSLSVAGTMAVAPVGVFEFGSSYTVATGSARTGTFGTVAGLDQFGAVFDPFVDYTANAVIIRLLPQSLEVLSEDDLTGNALEVAQTIDQAVTEGYNPQAFMPVYMSGSGLPDALGQISGEQRATERRVVLDSNRVIRETAFDRLNLGLAAMGGQQVTTDNGQGPLTFWLRGAGSWGSARSNPTASGYTTSQKGVLTGVDWSRDGLTIGGMFFYTDTDISYDRFAGRSNVENTGGSLYAGYRKPGGIIANAGLSVAGVQASGNRAVSIPGFVQTLAGRTRGTSYQVFGELGWDLGKGSDTRIEPFARLSYAGVNMGALEETGGVAAVSANKQSYDITITNLGMRVGGRVADTGIHLNSSVSWQAVVGSRDAATLLGLSVVGQTSLIRSVAMDRSSALLQAEAAVNLSSRARLSVSYSGLIGNDNEDHAARATLGIAF